MCANKHMQGLSCEHTHSDTHTHSNLLFPPLCIPRSLVTLSHPSFPLPFSLRLNHPGLKWSHCLMHTLSRTHTVSHTHVSPPLPVPPYLVPSSMSRQKCIHAARACVNATKQSSSLMLLFLDEAKTKRHVFKERCQRGFVNSSRRDYRRLKEPVCRAPVSICLRLPGSHPRAQSFKGRFYLFLYFILLWLLFLAPYLRGKSWLSCLRNGALTASDAALIDSPRIHT